MSERITQVEFKSRNETKIYITTGQGGGCSIVLKPGTKMYQWTDGKFYIEVDEKMIHESKKTTCVNGYVGKKEKEKINRLVEEGKFKHVNDLVGKAAGEFLKHY